MPAERNSYTEVSADYFAKRGLRRYAGAASLWALGVGAVISGHYSGGTSASRPAAGAASRWPPW